jgi:type VI secretion system protein VasG
MFNKAFETVTKLSARYIAAKKLPDKAIDILDTACARVSTAKDTPPKRLSYLDNKIHEINVAIAEFDRDYQLGETVDSTVKTKLENQLTELAEEKNVLSSRFESQKALVEEILSLRTKLSDSETEYTEEERQELIAQFQSNLKNV